MTCPTTAVYDGLESGEERIALGKHLRFFGDGYQKSKLVGGRRYWRIPVMDGEFLIEDQLFVGKGVGGGNIILQAETLTVALAAARRASGGRGAAARASSLRFRAAWPAAAAKSARATRNSRLRRPKPTARRCAAASTRGLAAGANFAYEIVIDGCDEVHVAAAMSAAMHAAAGPASLPSPPATTAESSGSFTSTSANWCSNDALRSEVARGGGRAICPQDISPAAVYPWAICPWFTCSSDQTREPWLHRGVSLSNLLCRTRSARYSAGTSSRPSCSFEISRR